MDRLWDWLEQLPDQRTLKGRRYTLAAIVGISLAAMLSGANDLRAIFRWGRRLTPKGLAAFGIGHGRAPCHATYHYVFRSIAAADLERALRGSVPSGSAGHVAIDGKRLRGSQSENSPGIHEDCREIGGHAAMAAGGCGLLAAWKRCPKPGPSVPL